MLKPKPKVSVLFMSLILFVYLRETYNIIHHLSSSVSLFRFSFFFVNEETEVKKNEIKKNEEK
jgi:hypothetical protein